MRKCILCGDLLPEGGRRDRRYCREACRVMAYRQRRDGQIAADADTSKVQTAAQVERQSQLLHTLTQKIADLAQELSTLSQRVAMLEGRSRGPAPSSPADEPRPSISSRPSSPLSSPAADEKNMGEKETLERTLQETLSRLRDVSSAIASASAPASILPEGGEHKTRSGPAATSSLAPWMTPSPKHPARFVPRWTLWSAETLAKVDQLAEATLAALPEIAVRQGHYDVAVQLKHWLDSEGAALLPIAITLARRIVAIKHSERDTDEQRMKVAGLAAEHLAESLPCTDPVEKQRCMRAASAHAERVLLIGTSLTYAARRFDDLAEEFS